MGIARQSVAFPVDLEGDCGIDGIASRPLPGSEQAAAGGAPATQTLMAWGSQLRLLTGAGSRGHLELGPPLQLFAEPAALIDQPVVARRPWVKGPISCPVWDAHSGAIYFVQGGAIVRLGSDDTAVVVAGGLGPRPPGCPFTYPSCLASDGAGALYLAEGSRILSLQLPAAAAGSGGACAPTACVSTLLPAAAGVISGLDFDGSSGSLVFATRTAVYRLPLGGAAAGGATAAPVLMAGAEGQSWTGIDGRGKRARFNVIVGLAVDGSGDVYVGDGYDLPEIEWTATVVRRIAGKRQAVSTPVDDVDLQAGAPAILPNGRLALYDTLGDALEVLDMDLKQPPHHC